MRKRVGVAIAALVLFMSVFLGASPAAASDCYGESCVGLNPADTSCQYDAITIGAMDVGGNGMLELRWSPSCNASWGRFSSYWVYDLTNALAGTGISYARVTAWNPDRPSQDVASESLGVFGGSSWWTFMVTGETWSCAGVELFSQDTPATGSNWYSGNNSLGWTWGPCVA